MLQITFARRYYYVVVTNNNRRVTYALLQHYV